MLKKSTLLFIGTFFLLFMGLNSHSYGCHKLLADGVTPRPHGPNDDCSGDGGGGDEDTTGGKLKSIALIMTFDDDDMFGDNIQSDHTPPLDDDGLSPYVDEEGASVGASERSQPNPAAGIDLGLTAKKIKNRNGRQLDLNITCEAIPQLGIDNCNRLSELFGDGVLGFHGLFPTCEDNNFCSLVAAVSPYKVSCPGEEPLPCPDIFTMPGDGTTELMSYRLGFGGGAIFIEVASAIGGDGALDPGRCLSLLETSQRRAFLDAECVADGSNCNVSVMASNGGMGGENDLWRVVADGVTALICDRGTSTVLGKTTLWFGFNAIKK